MTDNPINDPGLTLDEWPEFLRDIAEIDDAHKAAIARCLAICHFLSAMHAVVNAMPALQGVGFAENTAHHHRRLDIGEILASADHLPDDLSQLIAPQLDELRALAERHNLSLIQWKAAIQACWARMEPRCRGPQNELAMKLVTHMIDAYDASVGGIVNDAAAPETGADRSAGRDDLSRADTDRMSSQAVAVPESLPPAITPWRSAPADESHRDGITLPPRIDTDVLAFVDTDDFVAAMVTAAVDDARTEANAAPEIDTSTVRLGAQVRRLQWTIGAICVAAVVLLIAMGLAVDHAQDRARELSNRANQPVRVQVTGDDAAIDWFQMKLPGTVRVGERTVTIRRASP